jgi:hypothetical protein
LARSSTVYHQVQDLWIDQYLSNEPEPSVVASEIQSVRVFVMKVVIWKANSGCKTV